MADASASESPVVELDESKLSSDDGEIYLFQWLSSLEKSISVVDKAQQQSVEAQLLKIINAPEPYPPPGRPIRSLVARCLVALYKNGETRTMFDTLSTLVKLISEYKVYDKDANKIAAAYIIGEIMAEFGSQMMSFMSDIATASLRNFKTTNNSVLMKYHSLLCLQKAAATAGKAISDSTAKDMNKQCRNALADRSLAIQRVACEMFIFLNPVDDGTRGVGEIESIATSCIKGLESADQVTRHSLARLAGHILASSQTNRTMPAPEPPKKSNKRPEGDEHDEGDTKAISTETLRPIMTVADMFRVLSNALAKPNMQRKTRVGIFDVYAALLTALGSSFVEANYSSIVQHLLTEIIIHPKHTTSRHEILMFQKLVGFLLRDLIGVRVLSEQGQIAAIQVLAAYLKEWPALMPNTTAPSPHVLVVVLKEVSGLLQQLGNAPPPVQDALSQALVTLLAHGSHSVRVSAAWTLRCYCFATPLRLPKIVVNVTEMLERDIAALATPNVSNDVMARSLGHAYGLAALFAVIKARPLYVSYDLATKVFDIATQLLKRAGEHALTIASVEVELAWMCIAALMTLGPNFARSHLAQLLVLWRNALPKPTSKDTSAVGRTPAEWTFMLQVRECALSAVLSFLRYNASALVTLDVARRIASLLSNAFAFANACVTQSKDEAQFETGSSSGPSRATLASREALLRRRIYDCYSALGSTHIADATQASLLQSTLLLFGSAEGYAGSSVQAAIASSAGNFPSVWQSTDGYAYGVTGLELHPASSADAANPSKARETLNRDNIEMALDGLLSQPILGSCEHDPLLLCYDESSVPNWPQPSRSATGAIDSAIRLFADLLPKQEQTAATRIISQLVEAIKSPKLDRNVGRKAAVSINSAVAINLALEHATPRTLREAFGNSSTANVLASFLKDAIVSSDVTLRGIGSEALGRLAGAAGTAFMNQQIKELVDVVVSNRDPYARAGCALAFGSIYYHVGGLSAGPLLKTAVDILMSLSNDPHPVVHFWALSALSRVVTTASLSYSPYIPRTLGMLFKLYSMESHEPEGGTINNSNLSGDLPAYQVVCEIVDAVVSVLGPDIQDSNRTRVVVLNLVREFSFEPDEGVRVEAIQCLQHLLMFAPDQIDIPNLVGRFHSYLSSSCRPLKVAAINALYQLVQRDAMLMSKLGGDRLVEDLFTMLDADSSIEGVRNVISSWLEQTVVYNPLAWIDLCQRIMAHTTASQEASKASGKVTGPQDDEGESLNVGTAVAAGSSTTSRWRTQLFALECLHTICILVQASGRREHLDIPYARKAGLSTSGLLVSRVPDLIKMAFSASAAYVNEIRLQGLVVLTDVIKIFATSPDPDYEEFLLLEQHQAPIAAALTPAFSADSTPEVLSSAIEICAEYIGCGVVRDVSRMGRILKLLVSALEQSKVSGMLSIGEVGELSPNASVMLRISTLSAWAKLANSGRVQAYIQDVVKPHRATLATLWISSLRDYATIRAGLEVSEEGGFITSDNPFVGLGREVLMPYYNESWPHLLRAVATLMSIDDPNVVAAMDGADTIASPASGKAPELNRKQPAAMFFVVFGMAFEAIVTPSASASEDSKLLVTAALDVMKYLVRPEYAGDAVLAPAYFNEIMNFAYKMALTESPRILVNLVEALTSLAVTQCARTKPPPQSVVSDAPLSHCLRICAHTLTHTLRATDGTRSDKGSPSEQASLILTSLRCLEDIGNVVTPSLRQDIRALFLYLYSELLKSESAEADLASPALPILKTLLESINGDRTENSKYPAIVHGFLSSCLQNVEAMKSVTRRTSFVLTELLTSGRAGVVATRVIKNNLLAAVLILTVSSSKLKLSSEAVENCCLLITRNFDESPEISLTAVHCAKTLIVASSAGNPMLQYCVKLLLPGLIKYALHSVVAVSETSEAGATQNAAVDEIFKAFAIVFAATLDTHRSAMLGVLLPTLIVFMQPQRAEGSLSHKAAVAHALKFASTSPSAFKEATALLPLEQKETLESSVKQAVGASSNSSNSAKPQIALRSF